MHIFIFCPLILSVLSRTEYSIKDTWPYSDDVLDPCFPDPCNAQGICSTSIYDEESYTCTCMNGYTGDTCDELLGECDADYCQNGGTCYWAFDTQSCYCDTGYTGDTCSEFSEEFNDPCMNLVCGSEEQGYCSVTSENEAECICYDGYYGDFCTNPIVSCTATQYMDLVQQLLLLDPEYREDCTYMATQIWAMIPVTDTSPVLCNCLTAMQQYIPAEVANLDCALENGLTLTNAVDKYCPVSCSQDTIDEMLTTVSLLSDECNHYVQNRDTMPLYKQNEYQCSCLLGVADTYEEALETFSCPFTISSASSGAVAWQNCYEDTVCDYEYIYKRIEVEMFEVDPISAELCLDFVKMISLTELVTPENNELRDVVSPCLEAIYAKWPAGIEAMDCRPEAHYEVTIAEIMQKFVHETSYAKPTCTYSLASSIFELSLVDFSGATTCIQAAVLGDQIAEVNDNFDELFCGCYDRLVDTDGFDAGFLDDCAEQIDWIVPSPQSYCESYLGTTYNFNAEGSGRIYPEESFASSSTDEDVWETVGSISTCVLVVLIILNAWILLTTKKSTSYDNMQEDTATAQATSG